MDTIVFVSYETSVFPCGGVAAVMNRLPLAVQNVSPETRVMVISPWHQRIPLDVARVRHPLHQFRIDPLGTGFVRRYGASDSVEYFVGIDRDLRHFAGRSHPYDVGQNSQEQAAILRRDALLFGMLTRRALECLNVPPHAPVFLQDWEAATTALALSLWSPNRYKLFLTLHNSYDSGAVTAKELQAAGIDPASFPGAPDQTMQTVLERARRLLRRPVTTVSEQFARDLTTDPLQAQVMADHLQTFLRGNIVGVPNGPFMDLAVPQEHLTRAANGELAPLTNWKAQQKRAFLEGIGCVVSQPNRPVWGNAAMFAAASQNRPLFVMAGRDDPRQKGYDVAAAAVQKHLSRDGRGAFLFLPIPGDEGLPGLGFLERLASHAAERVLVCPFRFPESQKHLYSLALQGADFGLLPSLYEPFGMANEFILSGTVPIARATGGLIDQVGGHGALYREGTWDTDADDWRAINAGVYHLSGSQDRVAVRDRIPLFRRMRDALAETLNQECAMTNTDYCRSVVESIRNIEERFSWERSAKTLLSLAGGA